MHKSLNILRTYVFSSLALGVNWRASWQIFRKQTKNIRVRVKMASHQPNDVYSIETIYGRLYFRDNFGDITNLATLFYPPAYRADKLENEGVVLDVGANIGLIAAWFSFHNPDKPIYCFEPVAENVEMIRRNCPTATVMQVAVGANQGFVELQVDGDDVIASSIETEWQTNPHRFEQVTLDESLAHEEIHRISLLKIDAEGMEWEILQGATATLTKVERIAMETHGREMHGKILELLHSNNFEITAEEFNEATGMVFADRARN